MLRLLEIEPALGVLDGVVMEIDDCAFPLVHDIVATSDLKTAFDGTSWALLVGSVPRKAGMERGDLLSVNGGIFKPQGRAIAENADVRRPHPGRRQPMQHELPDRPLQRARGAGRPLVRHDPPRREPGQGTAGPQGRGAGGRRHQRGHLGQPLGHPVPRLRQRHASAASRRTEVITDDEWLRGDFISTVQKRGAAIIEARGSSSAASAAAAAIDTVVSLRTKTAKGDCVSVAVASSGQYGAPEGLQFGFPVHRRRQGRLVGGRGLRPRRLRHRAHRGDHR